MCLSDVPKVGRCLDGTEAAARSLLGVVLIDKVNLDRPNVTLSRLTLCNNLRLCHHFPHSSLDLMMQSSTEHSGTR